MINTTGHFLRFNMGEEEDTSLPKIVSADNIYPKGGTEKVFLNIKKGALVSTDPNKLSPAMNLVENLKGQNVTAVGDYDVFVPEVGVVTINITENPPINPTEINLKITNITKTEENPILYDPYLECYYVAEVTDMSLIKVLYYKLYRRIDNYRSTVLNLHHHFSVLLVPLFNYLNNAASISFNFQNFNLEDILYNIPVTGRFKAAIDDIVIKIPNGIDFSNGNPLIIGDHHYEYNIYQGIFNLMEVTPE